MKVDYDDLVSSCRKILSPSLPIALPLARYLILRAKDRNVVHELLSSHWMMGTKHARTTHIMYCISVTFARPLNVVRKLCAVERTNEWFETRNIKCQNFGHKTCRCPVNYSLEITYSRTYFSQFQINSTTSVNIIVSNIFGKIWFVVKCTVLQITFIFNRTVFQKLKIWRERKNKVFCGSQTSTFRFNRQHSSTKLNNHESLAP